jgi:hypothetical protein
MEILYTEKNCQIQINQLRMYHIFAKEWEYWNANVDDLPQIRVLIKMQHPYFDVYYKDYIDNL